MTVCTAAICASESAKIIVGATDCKVTVEALNIQYEPPVPKWYQLSSTGFIVALWAGDATAQAEICSFTRMREPRTVHEAVRFYCEELGYYNYRQAEQDILFPLGLTGPLFYQTEKDRSSRFCERVFRQMDKVRAEIETIICGIDGQTPQLYTIDRYGRSYCNNTIGFAAIGDGAGHAESQYMFNEYHPDFGIPESLMVTYIAKKRAEVASGVGENTRMFFIGDGGASALNLELVAELKKAYERMEIAQREAVSQSYAAIAGFFNKSKEAPQDGPDSPPEIPRDSTEPPPPQQDGSVSIDRERDG